MNFRNAEFPTDVLSVKRLRVLFPDNFDRSDDCIVDGFTRNNFFYPAGMGKPEHLERLNQMICDERVVACGAFYSQFLSQRPKLIEAEEIECIKDSKAKLEENYQFFKLADSPETARLLVRQVEEEGETQAREIQSKSR